MSHELELYPSIEPYHTEMLQVSDLHTIYVEEAGNPEGEPVVFLHGGQAEEVRMIIAATLIQSAGELFYLINEDVKEALHLLN